MRWKIHHCTHLFAFTSSDFYRRLPKSGYLVRPTTTVVFGIQIACTIQIMCGVVAIACVGLHIPDPEYWRPIYKSLNDAYTLRRSWR